MLIFAGKLHTTGDPVCEPALAHTTIFDVIAGIPTGTTTSA